MNGTSGGGFGPGRRSSALGSISGGNLDTLGSVLPWARYAHSADVTRLLQRLVAKGALLQEGQGRWSRYRLPDAGRVLHKDRDSEHKAGDSVHRDASSVHKAETSEHSADLLAIIASERVQQRVQPDETVRIVLGLCRGRWLTRNHLAERLDRHPDGLRSRFLKPMDSHGRLRLRYPAKPNRADQAYTADDLVKEDDVSLTKHADK